MHGALATARTGVRQLLFITGEAGLGKTTLVEAFLASLAEAGPLWLGCGQCLDHYGAGEAYLPVLEALGRLCRGPGGQEVVALLAQKAPTWLGQLPGLVPDAERKTVQRRAAGATPDRMLWELAEALEQLSARQPRLPQQRKGTCLPQRTPPFRLSALEPPTTLAGLWEWVAPRLVS